MRLTQIKATNLKSRNIDYTLAPITIFCAPNGTGKTAIREAITLGINRYVPSIGKEASATLQLASDKDITVTAELDNGQSSTQKWSTKSPKYVGNPVVELPAAMVDLNTFFAMTGPQRAAHVFSLSDPAELGFSDKNILKALAGIEANSQLASEFKAELIEETKLFIHENSGKPMQTWIQALVDDIAEQSKNATRDYNGLMNTQTAKAGKSDGELFGESIPDDVDQLLADAREKLSGLNGQHAANLQRHETAERTLSNIEQAKSISPAVIPEGDTDAIQKEIDKLTAEREAITIEKGVGVGVRCGEACTAWNKAKAEMDAADRAFNVAANALGEFKEDCVCSECKRVYPPEMVKAAKKRLKDVEKGAKLDCDAKSKKEAQLHKAYSEASAADKANTERATKRQTLSDKIGTLQSKRTNILNARAKAQAATPNYGDETELKKQLSECESKGLELATKIVDSRNEVARLEGLQRKQIEARNDAKRAQEDQEARWNGQAKHEILKAAKKALLEVCEAFNASIWQGLVKIARRMTDGLEYDDTELVLDFDGSDLIYWKGWQRISVDAMSGAQRLFAHVGLQLALCAKSPLRIVLCDEMSGPLDDPHTLKFIDRIQTLIKDGVIDNFIGFDWNFGRYPEIAERLLLSVEQFKIVEVK